MAHPVLPTRDDLVRMHSVEGAHRVGLRAAISVVVPLSLVLVTGHAHWAPYASFGAFTALYGRNLPHLARLQMQLSAAATLTLAVSTGVVMGAVPQLVVSHPGGGPDRLHRADLRPGALLPPRARCS